MRPMRVQCPECGKWCDVVDIKRVFTEPITLRWGYVTTTNPVMREELTLPCKHSYQANRWRLVMGPSDKARLILVEEDRWSR